jgi:2-C-methyl-D-erythritol 2,4-cyclodiphosphate synthase
VSVIPASPANLKVTHAEDIPVADALLRGRGGEGGSLRSRGDKGDEESEESSARAPSPAQAAQRPPPSAQRPPVPPRIGIGYDAHRFASGRRLVLGGVEMAHDRGLDGHSDADVLLHAIADALLGAAALGDIGLHFPPSDERFRDADSQVLLREVVRLLREAGWAPGNVDATLLAEAPRMAPYVPQMRERIATCLGLSPGAVGVKATTNEGMGAIGRGEGIAALATVTLVPAVFDPER